MKHIEQWASKLAYIKPRAGVARVAGARAERQLAGPGPGPNVADLSGATGGTFYPGHDKFLMMIRAGAGQLSNRTNPDPRLSRSYRCGATPFPGQYRCRKASGNLDFARGPCITWGDERRRVFKFSVGGDPRDVTSPVVGKLEGVSTNDLLLCGGRSRDLSSPISLV